MSLMSGALGTHGHASELESHGACGDARTLSHWEAGQEPQDTWRHRSPFLLGGGPGGIGHVATLEPSYTGRRVWSHGTHGDIRVLPCRVAGPVARSDARALPHREAGLEPQNTCNTRALPYRVTCPVPQGTWQCQSSLAPGAGLELQGHAATPKPFPVRCEVWRCGTRLKSCA
jgi:hypothetical protein